MTTRTHDLAFDSLADVLGSRAVFVTFDGTRRVGTVERSTRHGGAVIVFPDGTHGEPGNVLSIVVDDAR